MKRSREAPSSVGALDLFATVALTVQPIQQATPPQIEEPLKPNAKMIKNPEACKIEKQRRDAINAAYDNLRLTMGPWLRKRGYCEEGAGRFTLVNEARKAILDLETSIRNLRAEIELIKQNLT